MLTPLKKEPIMFLPAGYTSPKSSGAYTKLEQGETRLRILSAPIIGWQDWKEENGKKIPLRFKYEEKPNPVNAIRPVKHFWAMLVFNYKTQAIEIFELTQASIRKELEALCNSEDWGAPYFYDIKICKQGQDLKTNYTVTPVPHKPLSPEIRQAFEDKPCNLECMFWNEDPFAANLKSYTKGVFSDEDPNNEGFITAEQLEDLEQELSACDEAWKTGSFLTTYEMLTGHKDLAQMPAKSFDRFFNAAKKNAEETNKAFCAPVGAL